MKLSKFVHVILWSLIIFGAIESHASESEEAGFKDKLSYGDKSTYFSKDKNARGVSEVWQSRQKNPWRTPTWDQKVNHFVSQLRKGNKTIFLYADYGLLDGYANPHSRKSVHGYPTYPGNTKSEGVIRILYDQASQKNMTVKEYLTKGDPKIRRNIILATLPGLKNKDPRVRLIAINLLRRLGPDMLMYTEVQRALVMETVTTEVTKWRPKDIDIPTIENPRLGAGVSYSRTGESTKINSLVDRFKGYDPNKSFKHMLSGYDQGKYLSEGLYQSGERNDYLITLRETDHYNGNTYEYKVWTKSSLLRFSSDNSIDLEINNVKRLGKPIKHVYPFMGSVNPHNDFDKENLYYAYHNVWEELKKLELFVKRAIWIHRIKDQNKVMTIANLSKDSFRALADQIDGEDLENVPMKSPSFKILGEEELESIIAGMLHSKVVSTRESCVRFLKRLYETYPGLSKESKQSIKLALQEARRRELLIDTVRGRHLQAELLFFKNPNAIVEEPKVEVISKEQNIHDTNDVLELDVSK